MDSYNRTILIRGGTVVDGTGADAFPADVLERERGDVSVEESVHSMTGKLAEHFSLHDRGEMVRPG